MGEKEYCIHFVLHQCQKDADKLEGQRTATKTIKE